MLQMHAIRFTIVDVGRLYGIPTWGFRLVPNAVSQICTTLLVYESAAFQSCSHGIVLCPTSPNRFRPLFIVFLFETFCSYSFLKNEEPTLAFAFAEAAISIFNAFMIKNKDASSFAASRLRPLLSPLTTISPRPVVLSHFVLAEMAEKCVRIK
mmetsp:Transcript_6533/g.15878  ORF Transcript_6533/g.15878 Transcript_6533/m.15878 type:complete len:153 (-) Transcript_6533:155-613(-)